jgi:hypothetical protein
MRRRIIKKLVGGGGCGVGKVFLLCVEFFLSFLLPPRAKK